MKAAPLALVLVCLPAWGQMYKCVDARGVTHYSDKPMPACKAKEVDIRGQPPISGKLDTFSGDHLDAERGFKERQDARDRESEKQAQAEIERQQRCGRMREQYQRFMSMRRVPNPGAKGERDYLDADKRDATAAMMESVIARDCR